MVITGLLLAAGAGRRMGGPKALVLGEDGTPWSVSASRLLRAGGCADVVVVVGAEAASVRALLEPEPVRVVEAEDWAEGMGASLRAGLRSLLAGDADCAVVHLVDLPDVGVDVVRRMSRHCGTDTLARATYEGRPGHPVVIGRRHWQPVVEAASGDAGARGYLRANGVHDVDCSDLAGGKDVDHLAGTSVRTYGRSMTEPNAEFAAVDKAAVDTEVPLHPIDEQTQHELDDARPGDVEDETFVGVRGDGAPAVDPSMPAGSGRLVGPRNDAQDADMSDDDLSRPAAPTPREPTPHDSTASDS